MNTIVLPSLPRFKAGNAKHDWVALSADEITAYAQSCIAPYAAEVERLRAALENALKRLDGGGGYDVRVYDVEAILRAALVNSSEGM